MQAAFTLWLLKMGVKGHSSPDHKLPQLSLMSKTEFNSNIMDFELNKIFSRLSSSTHAVRIWTEAVPKYSRVQSAGRRMTSMFEFKSNTNNPQVLEHILIALKFSGPQCSLPAKRWSYRNLKIPVALWSCAITGGHVYCSLSSDRCSQQPHNSTACLKSLCGIPMAHRNTVDTEDFTAPFTQRERMLLSVFYHL